jgi:hypothetical protein
MRADDWVEVEQLNEIRARRPEAIDEAWSRRTRRTLLGEDGRLLVVDTDHSAPEALGVSRDAMAMSNRPDLLRRLRPALARPGVEGVLPTPDILEDLLLMGALEGRLAFGSMSRGGLQGGSFELDDRFTSCSASDLASRGPDGARC